MNFAAIMIYGIGIGLWLGNNDFIHWLLGITCILISCLINLLEDLKEKKGAKK